MSTIIAMISLGIVCVRGQQQTDQTQDTIWYIQCNSTENVTRTIGSNFSVTLVSSCSEGDYGCEIKYYFRTEDGVNKTMVSVDRYYLAGNFTRSGVKFFYVYLIQNQKRVVLNLIIVTRVDLQPVSIEVRTQNLRGCTDTRSAAWIHFKGCQNNTRFNVALRHSTIARYHDIGDIICPDYENGRAVFSNGSGALQTQCLADSTWRDTDGITCLYPISARLEINNQPYRRIFNAEYVYSIPDSVNQISLNCSASEAGYEAGYTEKFLLQDKILAYNYISIHPNLNGINVSCYLENNFTKYFSEYTARYLSTSTIKITFGPYPPDELESLCCFTNGSIRFYSNPAATDQSLALFAGYEKVRAVLSECCGMSYGVIGQTISALEIMPENVTVTLRANYNGTMTYYGVKSCATESSTSGTDGIMKVTSSGDAALLAALSAVAGTLLIILIGCLVWGRRLKVQSRQ